MIITKDHNINHVESHSDNEANILFNFISMLRELNIAHGYDYEFGISKKMKVNIRYNLQELKEKIKVFKNKKLM